LYREYVTVSRALRIGGLLIAGSAVVLALVPFRAGIAVYGAGPSEPRPVSSCGWPVGDATRKETDASFAYSAPAKAEVTVPGHVGCAREARHRLVFSVAGLTVAFALGGLALVLDRRRRLDGDVGQQLAI
jgi:hypothetical protein